MITGHNRLNRHESLVNPDVHPSCRFCKESEETSWHLIGDCPKLLAKRRDSFKTIFMDHPPKWKPLQLMKFLHAAKMDELNSREGETPPLAP